MANNQQNEPYGLDPPIPARANSFVATNTPSEASGMPMAPPLPGSVPTDPSSRRQNQKARRSAQNTHVMNERPSVSHPRGFGPQQAASPGFGPPSDPNQSWRTARPGPRGAPPGPIFDQGPPFPQQQQGYIANQSRGYQQNYQQGPHHPQVYYNEFVQHGAPNLPDGLLSQGSSQGYLSQQNYAMQSETMRSPAQIQYSHYQSQQQIYYAQPTMQMGTGSSPSSAQLIPNAANIAPPTQSMIPSQNPFRQYQSRDDNGTRRQWADWRARNGNQGSNSNNNSSLPGQPVQTPAYYNHQFANRSTQTYTQTSTQTGTQQPFDPRVGSRDRRSLQLMKQITEQSVYLENLRSSIHSEVGISDETKEENERVRKAAESICRAAITEYETSLEKNLDFKPESVELQPFGSTATGFADKASDMDLALLSPMSNVLPEAADSPIPRLLELALLKAGFGAILITGARVPIIKVCQKPSAGLREDLLKARAKWEENYNSDKILKRHSFASAIQPTKFEAEIERAAKSRGVSDETEPESVLSEHVADIDALSQTRADGTVLSIHDYYRLAKKLLSDLGAHDSGLLNSPELTPEQTQTLDDVCRKFIVGLADEELSNKILYSKCFQCTRDKTSTPSKVRSLHSVKNVCEVEIMLKKWPRRALQEDKVAEDIFRQLILNWDQNVLNDSESNSTAFNRQVHHFHDRFSGCPSLKLVMLRQGKDEKARAYHKRASFLLKSLGGNERNPPKNTTLTIVKKAYIDGLYSDSMKRELKEWNKQPRFGLTRLCFLHRTFELIEDWEFGKWNDETKKRLSEYIALLQCGLQTGKKSEDSTSACPVVPAQYRLLKWIATSPQALPPVTIDPSAEGRRSTNRHLEFPQSGVGVQFDINFAAGLAIRNTQLLKCYNACDPRVKEMVLFVKTWAKRRGINKPYYGTLSSYGYVLMVLHFLVNIAQPPVCPNIQQSNPPYGREETEEVNSFTVYFWRDDEKLRECARKGKFTNNIETVGSLLRGFFEYYGDNGMMSHYGGQRCFNWMQQVLTLRSSGGVMTKQTKGWVGAKTDVVKIGGTVSLPAAEAEPEADSGTTERGRASGSGETPVSSTSATPHETAADTGQTPQPEKPENSPKHHDVLIGPMTALTLLNQPRDATPPGAKPPKKVAPKTKEIRNRYLLAIEDPFEITHNVGRTVTHEGICGIRDEFRRALQIIRDEKVHYNVLGEGEERVLGEVSQMLIEERKEGVYGDWKREHQDEGYGIEELMRDWHGAETMKKVMRAKALEDVVVGEK